MLQTPSKKSRTLAALITAATALFLYIVNAATQGLIGVFATDTLLPKSVALLTTTQLPLIVPLVSLLAALGGGYACWHIHQAKTKEIQSIIGIYDKLIAMDSATFWWIQKMKDARNTSVDELDKVTKKAIEYLLGTATLMFHQAVYSGAFFALDGNVLRIWAHYRVSQTDVEDKDIQFDLSQTAYPPIGMARAAYCQKSIEIGRIEEDTNGWQCTNPHYIKIGRLAGPTQSEPPRPPYSSLICVPVIYGLKKHQDPLGIVCFHSYERNTFDNPNINVLAEQIAERISEALEFHQYLR